MASNIVHVPEGFEYIPGFLTTGESRQLMKQIEALDFVHDSFRGKIMRRGYVQYGFAYVTTGRKVKEADPIPDWLNRIIARALQFCPPGSHFNQCIITKYPPQAGIGWHVDASVFGECIAAISLGSEARLELRKKDDKVVCHKRAVEPGSLYVLSGATRWLYEHPIPAVRDTRYSLTFRHVTGA